VKSLHNFILSYVGIAVAGVAWIVLDLYSWQSFGHSIGFTALLLISAWWMKELFSGKGDDE